MSARVYSTILPSLLACAVLAARADAQDLAFEKYEIDNGLTVILHEDHSLPVVCVNLWYHVGAKDEPPGRSGFAHLFEHLMFMGTERAGGSAFDDRMEKGGGWNNASTSSDRTNYFSLGPPNLLPLLLWLEADRMEGLGKAMTQAKLDRQREVVRNERRQNFEMRPYARSSLVLSKLLYPPTHPYHRPVIGSHEDLEAATVDDVKAFFARYYVPNNASLVIAGDFDKKEAKELVARWFAPLPRAAEVTRPAVPPLTIDSVRRATVTDRVQLSRVSVVWPSPPFFAAADAEMDFAAAVLASGKSSRLVKRLVLDAKLCTQVVAYQASRVLGSEFHIVATARPGADLAKIETVIEEEVARLGSEEVSAAEIARRRTTILHERIASLESLRERADQFNLFEYFLGKPDSFEYDLDRYRNVDSASLRVAAKTILGSDGRVVLRVVPEAVATASALDTEPKLGAVPAFEPQPPAVHRLANGLELRFWPRSELPLARAVLLVKGGSAEDAAADAGLTALLAEMLDEGAGELDTLAFADRLTELGASFDASVDRLAAEVAIESLSENFDDALGLLAMAALEPRLEQEDFERVRALHAARLEQQLENPSSVARLVGSLAWFGADHPYGPPRDGTATSVEGIGLDALRARHRALFRPERAVLLVAGDLDLARATALTERFFGRWKGKGSASEARRFPAKSTRKPRVVFVELPGAVQTFVRFYMPGVRANDPNRVAMGALNTILGGSFTSRLNANLREQHGYTYGAASGLVSWPQAGVLIAQASVKAAHTSASVSEFLTEFKRLANGDVSEAEALKTRATTRQGIVESLEGLAGLLATAVGLEKSGLPFSALGNRMASVERIDAAGLNELTPGFLRLDQALLLMIGQREVVEAACRDAGLPAPEGYSREGRPLHER